MIRLDVWQKVNWVHSFATISWHHTVLNMCFRTFPQWDALRIWNLILTLRFRIFQLMLEVFTSRDESLKRSDNCAIEIQSCYWEDHKHSNISIAVAHIYICEHPMTRRIISIKSIHELCHKKLRHKWTSEFTIIPCQWHFSHFNPLHIINKYLSRGFRYWWAKSINRRNRLEMLSTNRTGNQ